jgi:tetratricopeptide (TPR) repeat protein
MKKSAIVLAFAALFSINAMAQTVQEGIGNLYAERYQSAKAIFEKLTAANPNNIEAIYWLGQTLLAQRDIAGAKALYQKTLAANGNAPWILVGMGHINLLEGKSAEARQQFEAAITASKVKKNNDPAILNAVGRANVQSYTDDNKLGDLEYAIAKLTEAAQIAPTNPDVFLTLGNAYRKKHNGGEAVQAYRKAGNYAPALYRVAQLYKTQNNWDVVLENLNSVVAADQRFAPAYFDLYYYNLLTKRDFNAAESFANKYIANSDPSVENDYLKAQTFYVQKRYQEAIDIANKIVQQTNNNPNPRVFRLLAYSNLELKDTAKACEFSNQFLAKVTEEELLSQDYLLHATVCGKNDPAIIRADIMKAVQMDSVLSRQLTMLNDAVKSARAQGQRLLEGELMLVIQQLRGDQAKPADLFYVGTVFFYGNDFAKADSVLSAYITAFPDSVQGYYWRGLARSRIDTSMTAGTAIPDFEKTLQLAEAEKERFKSQGAQSAQMLAIYYNNIKGDRPAAQAVIVKGLEFDPTNTYLLTLQKQLQGTPKQTPQPKTPGKTETKTKSTSSIGGSTKTKTKTKS